MKVEEYCNDDYVVDILLTDDEIERLKRNGTIMINTIKSESTIFIGRKK